MTRRWAVAALAALFALPCGACSSDVTVGDAGLVAVGTPPTSASPSQGIDTLAAAHVAYSQALEPGQGLGVSVEQRATETAGQWRAACARELDLTDAVADGLEAIVFTPSFAQRYPDFVQRVDQDAQQFRSGIPWRSCTRAKDEATAMRIVTDWQAQTGASMVWEHDHPQV